MGNLRKTASLHIILNTVRMGLSNDTSFSQFNFYENEKVQKISYP